MSADAARYELNIKALEELANTAAKDGQALADAIGEIYQPVVDGLKVVIDEKVAEQYARFFQTEKAKAKTNFDTTLAIIPQTAKTEAERVAAGLKEASKTG